MKQFVETPDWQQESLQADSFPYLDDRDVNEGG
jgi:hypothetical protein